ncbi:unnamed protein product [Amoebophrya sp. A120]|nr:unnamed protein product [Amoebophrya sp. A120]|eukprot:GSA120T00019380001.1
MKSMFKYGAEVNDAVDDDFSSLKQNLNSMMDLSNWTKFKSNKGNEHPEQDNNIGVGNQPGSAFLHQQPMAMADGSDSIPAAIPAPQGISFPQTTGGHFHPGGIAAGQPGSLLSGAAAPGVVSGAGPLTKGANFTGITYQANLREFQPNHRLDDLGRNVVGAAGGGGALPGVGTAPPATYKGPMGLSMPVLKPVQGLTGPAAAPGVILPQTGALGMPAVSSGQLPPEPPLPTEEDTEMAHLKAVRRRCGLNLVPAAVAVQTFRQMAREKRLDNNTFRQGYTEVLAKCRMEPPPPNTMDEVFKIFDKDHNGVVDPLELCCGIALFCQGTEEDKIHAIFDCFDDEGVLTNDELWTVLTAIYKVVLTPSVLQAMKNLGYDIDGAEDLASVTTLECFKQAEVNAEGKMNVEDFKAWFYAPKNDPNFMYDVGRLLQ